MNRYALNGGYNMSIKKKSYMNTDNIMTEGFIQTVVSLFRKGKIKQGMKLARNNGKIRNDLKQMGKLTDELKDSLKNEFGIDIKLEKYSLWDLIG
jgi:hypothetical protein